ncbi:6-bladed beta-propeller [Echinicola soli]|uniref:6-bladed beta-propeller n=1 Tax=Echinicola soli TaxID=2591634 RepID=A0A514CES4_9BACT|nr:6-bladed beta-propeller [Echinicola soli]QDH78154.1 6-bladed beta-propeller [Echinicola soli]
MVHLRWFSLWLLILNFGCKGDNNVENVNLLQSPIPVPSSGTARLSDFVSKIEYFLLPESISALRVSKALVYDSLYFLGDYDMTMSVSVIDSSMNHVANIRNYGEGPGEFRDISDFTINTDKSTVDILSLNKLIQYDFKGNFVNEFRTPFFFYKIQHLSADKYLVYTPTGSHPSLKGGDIQSVLWIWGAEDGQIAPVSSPMQDFRFPFVREYNNLRLFGQKVLFSTHFSDTIYSYNFSGEIIERRYFKSDKQYLPLDLVKDQKSLSNIPDKIRMSYYYHFPNLLENDNYLVTRLVDKGILTELIYSKKTGKSMVFSKIENDVDFGLEWMRPVLLRDRVLFLVMEPSWVIDRFEEGGIPENSAFYRFAKDVTEDTPLILAKYYLK